MLAWRSRWLKAKRLLLIQSINIGSIRCGPVMDAPADAVYKHIRADEVANERARRYARRCARRCARRYAHRCARCLLDILADQTIRDFDRLGFPEGSDEDGLRTYCRKGGRLRTPGHRVRSKHTL